jgi:transposase
MLLQGILSDIRKKNHSLQDIFNAIFNLLKTGYQWRILPCCFPKWEFVYYYVTKWKNTGIIEQIHELLHDIIRKIARRKISPILVLFDSQSGIAKWIGGENRRVDGGKKIKGCKRHINSVSRNFQINPKTWTRRIKYPVSAGAN